MLLRLYLVCCTFTSCLVAGQSTKYALLGQTVSIDPGITAFPDNILWKHNGNKVVDFDSNEERVYGTFENRITLDWQSAELNVSNLRSEDSGMYAMEAFIKGELRRYSLKVEVLDRVAKPTISCDMNNGNSSVKSGEQATLKCSVEPGQSPSLMKVEWSSHGKTQLGEKLTISLGGKHDDEVYYCTVSNPLSQETTTLTAKECYPNNSSAGLIAGLCVAFAVIAVILVAFCKLKQKACFAKENENDVESQEPFLEETKGSVNKGDQRDERKALIHRESTLASRQPLRYLNQHDINSQDNATEDTEDVQEHHMDLPAETPTKGTVQKLVNRLESKCETQEETGFKKNKEIQSAPPSFQTPAGNNKGDTDVHLSKELPEKESDPSDSEKSNDVSGNHSENKKADLPSPTAFKQSEAEEEADKEVKFPSANGVPSPAGHPRLPLTENSLNASPRDGVREHEEDPSSNLETEDTTEKKDKDKESHSSEPEEEQESEDINDKTDPTDPEKNMEKQTTTLHSQDPAGNNKQDTDYNPPGELTENQESDASDSKTVSEQPGLKKNKQKPTPPPRPRKPAGNDKGDADVEAVKEPTENKDCGPSDSNEETGKLNDLSDDRSENPKSDLPPPPASEQPDSENTRDVFPGVPDHQSENTQSNPQSPSGKTNVKNVIEKFEQHCAEQEPTGLKQQPTPSPRPRKPAGNDSENPKSDLPSPTASKPPESKKEEDGRDEAVAPANDVSPPVSPSPDMAPQDGAGEQKKDTSSHQVPEETTGKNVGESDSLGLEEENTSDNSSDVKEKSTNPEEKDAETTDEQNSNPEPHLGEDNQQESDNKVSQDNNKSDDQEEIDQNKNLPSGSSPLPQSPITRKPDNSNTSTSPDTEHSVPDQ